MRRIHRRTHFLIWLIVGVFVAAFGVVAMTQTRPNMTETFKPLAQ
jgi:hypothetical protein